jgi:hypothetical protein
MLPPQPLTVLQIVAGEQCLRPDSTLCGYVAAEVWNRQVNWGYGGAGLQLRGEAGRVLAGEIDRLR